MEIKKIAFPREHGSWGFFLEPISLSIIIAYSYPGLMLVIASLFIFLSHQPIKIFYNKKNETGTRQKALVFIFIYMIIILITIWESISKTQLEYLLPFFIAVVLMIGFLMVEIRVRKENSIARLIPPLAVDLIAVSIVRMGGMGIPESIAFYWVLLGRSAFTSVYVKEKLSKLKKRYYDSAYVFVLYSIYLIVLVFSSIGGLTPFLTIIAATILLIRAGWGLRSKKKTNVRKIGIWEFVHGIIFVIIVAIGYVNNL